MTQEHKSKTPRTDKEVFDAWTEDFGDCKAVLVEHAENLETQLSLALSKIEELERLDIVKDFSGIQSECNSFSKSNVFLAKEISRLKSELTAALAKIKELENAGDEMHEALYLVPAETMEQAEFKVKALASWNSAKEKE